MSISFLSAYPYLQLIACFVLAGICGYYGLHIIKREVIFVDLAMAQIAALGTTYAYLIGYSPESTGAYFFSLSFTIVSAAIFALTRTKKDILPQEAVIGIVYAVSVATAIVLLDIARDPHGAEHLKYTLTGNIVYLREGAVFKTSLICLAVGAFQLIFWKKFLLISTDPDSARAKGVNILLWDFLFYASFGIVITSSVQIAGVLLVFAFLIVPALTTLLFFKSWHVRFLAGWAAGFFVAAVGLIISYSSQPGPVIVSLFGLLLLVAAVIRYLVLAQQKIRAAAYVGAGAIVSFALVAGATLNFTQHSLEHDHQIHAHHGGLSEQEEISELVSNIRSADTKLREECCAELCGMNKHEILNEVKPLLKERDVQVQISALRVFECLGKPEDTRCLESLLDSGNDDIRKNVVQTIAKIGGTEAVESLRKHLPSEKDIFIRGTIALFLFQNGQTDVLADVFAVLKSDDIEFIKLKEKMINFMRKKYGQDFGYDPVLDAEENAKAISRLEEFLNSQK